MYDASKKFNVFYKKHVILPANDQNELRKKKNLNLDRLEKGLEDYNEENETSYKIAEKRVQGSMAMATVVQNDENEYDIDVAIVFEKDKLQGKSAKQARQIVADALKKKTSQFKNEPEVKNSCVRLTYTDGYHIDFAVFVRSKDPNDENVYIYEHAGKDWSIRDIRGVENWFQEQDKDNKLRKLVRLSKMYCRQKGNWKHTPSGIIQSVIVNEAFSDETELDAMFYETMLKVCERIKLDNTVEIPVDGGRDLTPKEQDKNRVTTWKNQLKASLKKLDILFDDDCSEQQAFEAWGEFFDHDYWGSLSDEPVCESAMMHKCFHSGFTDNEQFIEELYPVDEIVDVNIECTVTGNGFRPHLLEHFLEKFGKCVPINYKVNCKVLNDKKDYDQVLWKVRNVGEIAERKNDVRGQIKDNLGIQIQESTAFKGDHYIECYLIKNNVCVGIGYVSVKI